jgi:hypothetical protein
VLARAGSLLSPLETCDTMDRSISDVVNDAVRQTLSEDAADLEVFEKRRREPTVDFEEVVLRLRRSGKL